MLTIILSLQMRLKGLKMWLNKACPIMCKVAICTEFCQFSKRSNVMEMSSEKEQLRIYLHRVEDWLMIYLQAHDLFAENIS